MTALPSLLKVPGQVLGTVGSIAGVRLGTEEPRYTVLDQLGAVEIRRYGPRIAAETSVEADEDAARSIGFRRLAGYIFGGNSGAQKQQIAMTAPVAQAPDDAGSTIRFYMPSKFSLDALPEPDSAQVVLVPVPSETVAILRYSGDRSPAAVRRQRETLERTLSDTPYTTIGEPFSWFYDPPFTLPFRRRNEIGVRVTR